MFYGLDLSPFIYKIISNDGIYKSLEVIRGNWKFPLYYINLGIAYDVLIILGVIVESARGQCSKRLDPVAFLQSSKMSIISVDLLYYKNG